MARRLTLINLAALLSAVVLVLSATAHGEKPPVIELPEVPIFVYGGFRPAALPKRGPAPVQMEVHGTVKAPEGSRPPFLKELTLDLDRHLSVDGKGLAVCPRGPVDSPPPPERCRSAFLGKGAIAAEIEFPEAAEPIVVHAGLFAFNQGIRDGRAKILFYAHFGAPVNGAMITTAKVAKARTGRYGSEWTLPFPKIAGGFGWIKAFRLEIGRNFARRGKSRSYLLGRCPDGHLDAGATATFVDGTIIKSKFVRACTPAA
jgi:hypothetical protein